MEFVQTRETRMLPEGNVVGVSVNVCFVIN